MCIRDRCQFLHFGTTRQLITNGVALRAKDSGDPEPVALILNSDIPFDISGDHTWIEGCSANSTVSLAGFNAVVGVDVVEPLILNRGACIDMSAGTSRKGKKVWFLRCYGIDDSFKHTAAEGGTLCGRPLKSWLTAVGAVDSDVWSPEVPERERTLWSARVFPAVTEPQRFRDWLWLLDVESATEEQKNSFLAADRYSSSEIALRLDQAQFHERRSRIRAIAAPHVDRVRAQAQTY